MPRKKKSILKDKRFKFGILFAGVVAILIFSSTFFFSSYGTADLGFGLTHDAITDIPAGGSIDEASMNAGGFSLFYAIYSARYGASSSSEPIPDIDNSVCDLICTDNGVTMSTTSAHRDVTRFDVGDYDIWPYFDIDISNVYQGVHDYKLSVHGGLVGESFVFKIIGDDNSPVFDETGTGGGNTTMGIPLLFKHPDATITMLSNESMDLVWVVYDDNPDLFYLYENETLIQSGDITLNNATIRLTLENLTAGYTYIFKLKYVDADANELINIVTVNVKSTTPDWLNDPLVLIAIVVGAMMLLGGGGTAVYVKR